MGVKVGVGEGSAGLDLNEGGNVSSLGSNTAEGSSSSVANNEGSSSSGSGAGGESYPLNIFDENSILSGSGSTGTHSQGSVSQNPISTNPQPGADSSTSVTDDISSSTELVLVLMALIQMNLTKLEMNSYQY